MAQLMDGRWRVHLEGFPDVTTDELTLDDIETAERVCGVPWVLINPLASAKEAKALLVLLLMRADVTEPEALKVAGKVSLKKLAGAFRYELPQREPSPAAGGDGGEPVPPR